MSWQRFIQNRNLTITDSDATARWCNQHLPKDSKILIHDAGYMAYATPFHLIDFVGLKTPSSIQFHREITFPSQGWKRNEAISAIIKYNHPDYIVINDKFMTQLPKELTKMGWKLQRLHSVEKGYAVYQIQWS